MTLPITVTPRTARRFIEAALSAGLVPYLEGSPGSGKSSIIRSIAKDAGLKTIDYRVSTGAVEDLNGLPYREDDRAYFVPFVDTFPVKGMKLEPNTHGWMLFLDELSNAQKHMQGACYKLLLDRMVGNHELHESVYLIAAGNSIQDRAAANVLGSALRSRMVYLRLEVSFDEWLEDVAIPHHYSSEIIAYLSANRHKLMDFDPERDDLSFACPRSWEFVNRLITDGGLAVTNENLPAFAGCVGMDTASEFIGFCRVFDRLPTLDQILSDPEGTSIPDESAIAWATSAMLLRAVTLDNAASILKYVARMAPAYLVLFGRSVRIQHPDIETLSAWGAFKAVLVKMMT